MATFFVAGIWQVVSLAVFIALIVNRVSVPRACIALSSRIIVVQGDTNSDTGTRPALILRIVHERESLLYDLKARIYLFDRSVRLQVASITVRKHTLLLDCQIYP